MAIVGALVILLAALSNVQADERPKDVGVQERVSVSRTQVDVIVWPPKDDISACESLGKHDFEIRIDRQLFTDFEVDPFTAPHVASASRALPSTGLPDDRPPRFVALLFDWWGIGGTGTGKDDPRGRAFLQARAYIGANARDRFAVLDIADDARFYSPSFETSQNALATLARLEEQANRTGFQIKGQHLDSRAWRNAVTEAVARLGAMESREYKDLFVLTTDVPVGMNNAGWQQTLKQAAAQNRVRIYSLDLAWDTRVLPFGLFAFSEAGGGTVFGNGATLSSAIQTLQKLTPCTFRITLNVPESKTPLPLSVAIRNSRFRVIAPAVVGGRIDEGVQERAELQNDLAAPNIERGLRVTPRMVAVDRGEASTEYVLTLLVEKTRDFDPADVGTLRVYGMVWKKYGRKPTIFADYARLEIRGAELREIRESGAKVFRFPGSVKIPNTEDAVTVIVSVHGPPDTSPRLAASREIEWNPSQGAAHAAKP